MNHRPRPHDIDPIDWQSFRKVISGCQSFVLTSHVRPDCDALGSELGMMGVLQALDKDVTIVNAQRTPPNLAFIDPRQAIRVLGGDVDLTTVLAHDALIVLDTSAWVQLGAMADVVRAFPGEKLVVDHHVGEDDFEALRFKDVAAEATGRLVVQAADALGVELNATIANPLFAAVATDTGWFRFRSTTAETYRVAARLIDAGAAPDEIYAALYEQDSAGRVRLKGLILSRLVDELAGRLVHTYVLHEDFAAMNALPTDTEDVINLALTVAGTKFAVIFVGLGSGGFKISLRSRCEVDCNLIAQQFGGGGHQAAAGATLLGSLDQVRNAVLPVVREALGEPTVR